MRSCLTVVALITLPAGLLAQNFNPANSYDHSTEFTSRGANGGRRGYVSQAFAYGNSAGLQTLTRVRYVMQDQEQATREHWSVGTTLLDAKGQPDYAKTVFYATGLMTPPGKSGIGSWIVIHNPMPSHLINHGLEEWHHVWQFRDVANWTTDGLSVHMSQAASYGGTLLCFSRTRHREIPRTDGSPAAQIIEKHGWSTVRPGLDPVPDNRAWRLETFFDEVVLNGAATNRVYNCAGSEQDPNRGYARLDPDFDDTGAGSPARFDDYRWTVEAGASWNGALALLLFSPTVLAAKIPICGGHWYLDWFDPQAGLFTMGIVTGGRATYDLVLPGMPLLWPRSAFANLPNFSAQALLFGGSSCKLSTLMSFRSKLLPKGFKAGSAVLGRPASIAKRVVDRNIVVRNDGAGTLTLRARRGSTTIGPATVVPERTAIRIRLHVAATRVTVSSNKSIATRFVYAYNR